MRRLLLINPNSSTATTRTMVEIAQDAAPGTCDVFGASAKRAPLIIVEPAALAEAAVEVAEIAAANDGGYDGFIIAAFGDPGLEQVRATCRTPVVGIAESAFHEAGLGGRRFGVATTTPALKAAIEQRAMSSVFAAQFTGVRTTTADPTALIEDKVRLRDALADMVRHCVADDGAQAVIIGGGPLGEVARELQRMFAIPVVARSRLRRGVFLHCSGQVDWPWRQDFDLDL